MYLVQILLPLRDNCGRPFPESLFKRIKAELTRQFKGLTTYSRSPAEGLWSPRGRTKHEDIVIYEVMITSFRRIWWRRYRASLEKAFRQESIVIRIQKCETV